MMRQDRTWVGTLLLAGAMVLSVSQFTQGVEVTLSLVTKGDDGKTVPLDTRQSLWKSPYGGWVVRAWPFGVRVDDTPQFEYQTAEEKLAKAIDPEGGSKPRTADDLLKDIQQNPGKKEELRPGDLQTFQLNRKSTITIDLAAGRHVIHPFGISFTVAANGQLQSQDARVTIVRGESRLDVLCHPVVLKTFSGSRSTAGPVRLSCGATALLNGLDKVLADYQAKSTAAVGTPAATGFRRLTVYLPASVPGSTYEVNGIPFELDPQGQITLGQTEKGRCEGGREIRLLVPEEPRHAVRPVGVRWFAATTEVKIASGAETVTGQGEAGSASLLVQAESGRSLTLGSQTVRLPAVDAMRPHELLLWNVATGARWAVCTAPLLVTPGGEWSCRIFALSANTPPLPTVLSVQLISEATGQPGESIQLQSAGGGIFSGKLPATAGLWRLSGGAGSVLEGQPLGLVLMAKEAPQAAISLYTYHNRGLVRRGDSLDLFWKVKCSAKMNAVNSPLLLRGQGVEVPIGKVPLPTSHSGGVLSGGLKLDTSALAPGRYEVTVLAENAAVYPLQFRVCQREPLSDFELYSYVFGAANPFGNSPVKAYYGSAIKETEPGLAPYLQETDCSLDAVFASYTSSPTGPALEKCLKPTPEEAAQLALTGLGMRAVPAMPSMLHHEEWNPKHTLPEDLASMRRRLALFTQSHADWPSFSGIALNWYATRTGYWEESLPLDGHQSRRNADMNTWIAAQTEERVAAAKAQGMAGKQLETLRARVVQEITNRVLPNAYAEWLADARAIRPDLTAHSGIPSFWFNQFYPPVAYSHLTQRDSVDYTDYGISPWGNFRAPAFLNMGNRDGQKLHVNFMTAGRHSRIATAFGAAGRGVDGLSLKLDSEYPQGEDMALLRIFERFGSYFTALEPLPDVAVYFNGWQQQKSVILHDLARMRRPGMLLAPEDIRAGRLKPYKVLFLAAVGEGEPPEVLAQFREFEANGGVILKDDLCHASVPGRSIGFAYDESQLHNGWGLAYPNGEWEFAHLWSHFKKTREKPLVAAFSQTPRIPVSTPDENLVISPLAGKESICCFVINQTLVPLSVDGKWRQHAVLPCRGQLLLEKGWHVRNLLTGTAAPLEHKASGVSTPLDFTRAEGAIYLLTKRELQSMSIRTERQAPHRLRLTAWLADAVNQPLADPLPFDVRLVAPDGSVLFHKFAALAPDVSLEVPIPVLAADAPLQLQVQDLVLGRKVTERVMPAPAGVIQTTADADLVGNRRAVTDFLKQRSRPVVVLLDEGQDAYRSAAERLQALLRQQGREVHVIQWDPADVRPLPLRWRPTQDDQQIVESLKQRTNFASRVQLSSIESRDKKSIDFADPRCGYAEYGPRLRIDSDVILLGTPETHLALAELKPWLRRVTSHGDASSDDFFVHYLWSPFQGGYDGLYLGCRDAAGASAAVDRLTQLASGQLVSGRLPSGELSSGQGKSGQGKSGQGDSGQRESGQVASKSSGSASPSPSTSPPAARGAPVNSPAPVISRAQDAAPLENMLVGKFGSRILDVAFSPSGNRLFVTVDSYGDSLFVLDPSGRLIDKRALHNRCGNSLWWRSGGRLRPLDDDSFRVSLWNSEYRYSLDRGWLGQSVSPPTGFQGRFTVPVAAPTLLEDPAHKRVFLGGARKLRALNSQGRLLWTFDDATLRTSTDDLLYPRSLFPRGLSGSGGVLLVAGFGIKHDTYARGAAVNASVIGLDVSTGKLLWQREGMLLNQGKVIPLEDRFLVVDDSGETRALLAASGEESGRLRPVGAGSSILPIPARDELLIIENNTFDRQGPTSQVYVRPLGDAPDRQLAVSGRVTDAVIAPDGTTATIVSQRGVTQHFSLEGKLLWSADTLSGGVVRLAPDGESILVGAQDGLLHWLNRKDGSPLRAIDFNPYNVTDGERFVKQYGMLSGVPLDQELTIPDDPPEPSYLTTLNPKKVTFGKNLLPEERLRAALVSTASAKKDSHRSQWGRLSPTASFSLRVEAGRTYLVELLAAAAEPEQLTPQTRLEVAVQSQTKSANLPYVGRLPLGRTLARRRAAFRADTTGEVTLTLRAVQPKQVGDAKKPRLTYDQAPTSLAGLLVGDVVVAEIQFGGRNLISDSGPGTPSAGDALAPVEPRRGSGLEPGPTASRKATGHLICQVKPWTGGNSTLRHEPYPCSQMALKLVDGVIANQDTVWTVAARGGGIEYAESRVRFKSPQEVRAIVVYEDNSGPLPREQGVSETTALHYGIYVHEVATGKWRQIGHVQNNTQLVNIFECPPVNIDEIRYFWAGRNDADRTDGLVRMAELEVYSADDLSGVLDRTDRGLDDLLDRKK